MSAFDKFDGDAFITYSTGDTNSIIRYKENQYDSEYSVLGTIYNDDYQVYITEGIPWTWNSSDQVITILSGSEETGFTEVKADLSGISILPSDLSENIGGLYFGSENPQLLLFPYTDFLGNYSLILVDIVTGEVTEKSIPAEDKYIYQINASQNAAYYILYNLDISNDLTLYKFSADEDAPTKIAVITPEPDEGQGFSLGAAVNIYDIGMLAISYIDSGNIVSSDYYRIDGNKEQLSLIFNFSQPGLKATTFFTDESDEEYFAPFADNIYYIYTMAGKKLCEINTETYANFSDDVLEITLTPDHKSTLILYMVEENMVQLTQYSLKDGVEEHSVQFELDTENIDTYFTSDNHLILTGDSSFAEISLDEDAWGLRAASGVSYHYKAVYYDKEKDRYCLLVNVSYEDERKWAYFPRYSTEDLINKATEFIAH